MPSARAAAQAYIEAVNAGDLDTLVGLFHPEAVLAHPAGTFRGRPAIAGFYRDLVLAFQAQVRPVGFYEAGPACVAEVEGSSPLGAPDQLQAACDVFEVDSHGAIAALRIYYR